MKRYILFLMAIIFVIRIDVSALNYGGCDYSSVSRMKSLVTNVNISYDYHIENNEAYFDVTLNNITPGMYFVDSLTNITYTYADTQNGEVTIYNYDGTSGNFKFYSNLSECYGIKIGVKYYKFPIYNVYHNHSLCSDIQNFSLCRKWVNKRYSYEELEALVYEYKNNFEKEEIIENVRHEQNFFDKLVELYINYYYYFLGATIIICGSIIILNRRKNKFDL